MTERRRWIVVVCAAAILWFTVSPVVAVLGVLVYSGWRVWVEL